MAAEVTDARSLFHALRQKVWPWSEFARLQQEIRGARLSGSAEAKRGNRLAARIAKLDQAITKHRAQERHDQAYIDALEARLESGSIQAARTEVSA